MTAVSGSIKHSFPSLTQSLENILSYQSAYMYILSISLNNTKTAIWNLLVEGNNKYTCTWHVIHWPGVIQFESNRGSDGRITPFWRAFLTRSWASLADRNLLPRCWFIFALGATPSTARKSTFWGLMMRKRDWKRKRKKTTWNQMSTFSKLSWSSYKKLCHLSLPPKYTKFVDPLT